MGVVPFTRHVKNFALAFGAAGTKTRKRCAKAVSAKIAKTRQGSSFSGKNYPVCALISVILLR